MARRIAWTNNSSGHSGAYVYRAPTLDPQNLPAPVATVDPVAQGAAAEWTDSESLDGGDYDYAVQDFDDQGEGALSAIETYTAPIMVPNIGDEWQGGIYVGISGYTEGAEDWYLIAAKSTSIILAAFKEDDTSTSGTESLYDGQSNTDAMLNSVKSHPCAEHCANLSAGGNADWYMPSIVEGRLINDIIRGGHTEYQELLDTNTRSWCSTMEGDRAYYIQFSSTPEDGTNGVLDADRWAIPVRRVPV